MKRKEREKRIRQNEHDFRRIVVQLLSYFYFLMILVTAAFKLLSAKGTVYSENQFLLPAFFFPMYRSQFSDLCIAQFLC